LETPGFYENTGPSPTVLEGRRIA